MLLRLVRLVNIVIAALAVLLSALVYWYVIRPMPKVSGEMSAPISANATVQRDERGIPHIVAGTWQDALFLQGYVTAQDRLWQMDGLRRYAGGDLSEVSGAAALELDKRARALRMKGMAEANVARLTPEDRAAMVEYARGVNYYIETHRGDYPLEFSIPGYSYDPRPWTLADSMLVGLLMFRDLTDSLNEDLGKGELLRMGADRAKFQALFPAAAGGDLSPGSNAWAVAGWRTASGKPMAANDPHLRYNVPGTWHLVHLKAPGLNVSGASLPGVPCVVTGHNENIAWGVTNLETDVMDVYEETIDERDGRYKFQGKIEQAKLDREVIAVKGGQPVTMNVWVTRHGPVMNQNGKAYSVRWTAAEGFGFPFLQVDRAKNWDEFRAALAPFWGPGQNFVYADNAGNIGYQATGRVPVRRHFSGDAPLDGASGQYEWDGYIPFEEMPRVYNPASGIIATANQNPFPRDYAYAITGFFADDYRVRQIRALLGAKAKLTVDDMLAVQKDVYSAYDLFLAKQALPLKVQGDLASDALKELRGWNGQMDKEEAAPAIAELFSGEIRDALVKLLAPMPPANLLPRPALVEKLLRERPRGFVPNDNWDDWLASCLRKALERGREQMGGVVARWRWGQQLRWQFKHPVISRLPLMDTLFDLRFGWSEGPFPMSGASTTVKQTTPAMGPSERMVVDFGDLDRSVQNVVLGESGFVSSKHYKDQWPAYYDGKSFPMEFERVRAEDELRVTPR